MSGSLFSRYFLDEGVAALAGWADTAAALPEAQALIAPLLADFAARAQVNEANTEHDAIEPLLALLGWNALAKQENLSARGRADVPDYLLFLDAAAKDTANSAQADRYRHGATILEGKRWGVPLDNASRAQCGR